MRARIRLRIAAGLACAALAGGCQDERGAVTPAPQAERPLPPLPDGPAGLIPAFSQLPAFEFPVAMLQAPGDPQRWCTAR